MRKRNVQGKCRALRLWFAFLCGAALACLSLLLVPPAGATSVPAVSPSTSALAHSTAVLKSALTAVDRHTNDAHTALDNTPGAPVLLEELWRDVRHWVALRLEAAETVRAIEHEARRVFNDHAPRGWSTLSALRLDAHSVVFSVNLRPEGTVFILRRAAGHTFVTAMNLSEPRTWGAMNAKASAAWQPQNATERAQARTHVLPLSPVELARLPSAADGARRFAVVGNFSPGAGGLERDQVSIWRWHRSRATPLLTVNLEQSYRIPVIAHVGRDRLILQEKGRFSQFYACVPCAGRQLAQSVELPLRGGAHLGAVSSLTPQLDLVDRFFRRTLQCQPPANLSTHALSAPSLRALCRRGQALSGMARLGLTRLGMLENVRFNRAHGREVLCLTTENLHHARIFTLVRRPDGQSRIAGYQVAPRSACGYRNTYRVSRMDGGLLGASHRSAP